MEKEILQENYKLNLTFENENGLSIAYLCLSNNTENTDEVKSFKVAVDASTLDGIKNFKIASIADKVKIKGFRPGKVPHDVIWQQNQDSIVPQIMNQIINQVIAHFVNNLKIRLSQDAKVNIENFSFDDGFNFSITLDHIAHVKLPDVSAIVIDNPVYSVSEQDVKARIDLIRSRYKNHIPAEEGAVAKHGDLVTINFEGKIDSVAFENGTAKNHKVEIGSKSLIDNFEEQIIGHKVGDQFVVKVSFPDDYHVDQFKGKKAEFDIELLLIEHSQEVSDDEELAKMMNFESYKIMYDQIAEIIQKECEAKVLIKKKIQLFDKLNQIVDFKLPQSMLDTELEHLIKQKPAKVDGEKEQTTEEEKSEYLPIATRRVKLGILLSEFALEKNIQVLQNDFVEKVREMIKYQHPSVAQSMINYYNQNPQALKSLEGSILEDKTVSVLLTEVSNKDTNVPVSELIEGE